MGLLDFLNSDESRLGLGLLAAAGPSATPMSAGQRIQAAFQGMDAQKLEKLKSSLIQSQIDENASQNEQRKYAIQEQKELNALLKGAFGGASAAPTSPGAFVPSIDGMGPTMPKSMAPPASVGGIGGMTADQVAMLKAKRVDLTELWKFQQEPHKMEQGSTYIDKRTGKTTYMPKVGEGMAPDANNFYDLLPGYAKAQATLEGSKAAAVAAANAGFDPLTITPANGRPVMSTRGAVVKSISTPQPGFGAPDGDQFVLMSEELAKEEARAKAGGMTPEQSKRNASDIAGLKREIARLPKGSDTAASASGLAGIPLQSEAEKAGAVKQATEDVRPIQERKNDIAANIYLSSVVDQALAHPGLKTGTGISGTIHPSNYIPGTDAKNFHVLLDQLKGGTFLQAFANLKGGGSITEVEGTKATNAIARLNTAQSTTEFESALREFKQVLDNSKGRMNEAMPKSQRGVTGSFDEPAKPAPAQSFDSKPPAHLFKDKAMTGPDGKRYKSDGLIWKEVK